MKTLVPGLIVIDDTAALQADLAAMEPWPSAQVLAGFESHENTEAHVGDLAVGVYASRPGQLSIDPAYPVDEVIKILSGELVLREPAGASFKRFGPGEWLYVGRGFAGIWELRGDFRELHILPGEDAPEGLGDGLPEMEGVRPDQVGLSAVTTLEPAQINSGSSPILSGRKLVVQQLHLSANDQLVLPQGERIIAIQAGQLEAGGTIFGTGQTLVLTEEFDGALASVTNSTILEISHAARPPAGSQGRSRPRVIVSSDSNGWRIDPSNWGNSTRLAR